MNPLEKKAALALRPYMNSEPVIFDVGSNKGEWADILIENAKEMHLFEPNERLLIYTMVKYDHLKNVTYVPKALFSKSKTVDFFFFTNTNNGLSSVFRNQIWVDMGLPMQETKVEAITLDAYWDKEIDFLKIDVEGADLHVLKGAERLLSQKKIKFIQVECSDHLLLAGHTWGDVLAFMASHSYKCYDFNGTQFFPVAEPYQSENFYFMAEFTQNWNSEFIKNTEFLKGKVNFALEVGCFEGLTTNYICDNLLLPEGRVICVDPLWDQYLEPEAMKSMGFDPGDETNTMFAGQYERFIRNTKGKPVELVRDISRTVWKTEKFYHYRFDFIYLDGDHREDEIFNDGMEAFRCCLKQGYILFDDYGWRAETKAGIDKCLRKLTGLYELVLMDYQVMIKKIKNLE